MDTYTIEMFLDELVQVIDKYWLVTLIAFVARKTEPTWAILYLIGAIIFGPANMVYQWCMFIYVLASIGYKGIKDAKKEQEDRNIKLANLKKDLEEVEKAKVDLQKKMDSSTGIKDNTWW